MTVLENVVAPLREFRLRPAQRRRGQRPRGGARRGAARVRRHARASATSRRGALSYGQQKLVELAQVLMLDPKLILLDEPAGGINPTLIERMGDMIRELNAQGKTFLIVEHNMPFVLGLCDPVLVLARGQLHRHGTPDEIQQDPRVLDAYLGDDFVLEEAGVLMLRLSGVVAGYGGGDVLQGVDLEVARGLDRLHRRPQRRRQVDRAARGQRAAAPARGRRSGSTARGIARLSHRRDPAPRASPRCRSPTRCSRTSRCARTC